jgi:diadenosine tetraphosphate (Ap4A) HIT family hydrolase
MLDFSEQNIKNNCSHCDAKSLALERLLKKTKNFWIVCDIHPLTEGHILIIPKKHISCVGAYSSDLFKEFIKLYSWCSEFIKTEYGSVASFEHGIIGQTVFHSHVHLMPYRGNESEIIPEGRNKLKQLKNISGLRKIFLKEGQYLFFSIGDRLWMVDPNLGTPRFFRDRFAKALGRPERGNWKKMHKNKEIISKACQEIKNLKRSWRKFIISNLKSGDLGSIVR